MKESRVVVWGGCHVAGYPMGPEHAFPAKLGQLRPATVVGQVATLSFLRMPAQLASLRELRPTHVVLQLGNYEFSASFSHVLRLFKQAFRAEGRPGPLAASATGNNSSRGSSRSVVSNSVDALPAKSRLAYYSRVGGLGLLTAGIWLLSRRYRRAFQALNACVAQYPGTAFLVLSPLPCLDPAANALRRWGGRLLRHGLRNRPNLHWLNTHQVLATSPRFFADQSHLNEAGHQAVAQLLDRAFRLLTPAQP